MNPKSPLMVPSKTILIAPKKGLAHSIKTHVVYLLWMHASWHAYSITSSTRIELSNHKEKIVTPEEWPIKRDHISIYILITNLDGNSMSGKIVRAPKQASKRAWCLVWLAITPNFTRDKPTKCRKLGFAWLSSTPSKKTCWLRESHDWSVLQPTFGSLSIALSLIIEDWRARATQ